MSVMCRDAFSWGGGEAFWPIDQLLLLKRKVTENTVANSLAAWLTFNQLSCNGNGGHDAPHAPYAPIGTSLMCVFK